LVIAFHGAGGDENMFMNAYGLGLIKAMAKQHGALLVTPLTYAFGGEKGGPLFDALVDSLARDYPVDRERIFVLGHSMGGGMTASLINRRGDAIKAAACICGFRGFQPDAEVVPPTLVIAAKHDPIVNPAGIEKGVEAAKAAGHPVTYRLLEHHGHTLAVTDVLPQVFDWFFEAGQ